MHAVLHVIKQPAMKPYMQYGYCTSLLAGLGDPSPIKSGRGTGPAPARQSVKGHGRAVGRLRCTGNGEPRRRWRGR